jgi:hypothetical protein
MGSRSIAHAASHEGSARDPENPADGTLGDVLRSSLPIALACSGTAIAVLAAQLTTRGFEEVFKASVGIVKS